MTARRELRSGDRAGRRTRATAARRRLRAWSRLALAAIMVTVGGVTLGTLEPGGVASRAAGLLPTAFATPSTGATVELQRDVFRIASQLRCPVCVSESVAQSSSDVSIEMRSQIQDQLEAGRSEAEILASFQARYGDWILLEPPKRGLHLVVWLLPIVAGAIGVVVLAVLFRRWVRKAETPVAGVDPDDLARVRAELQGSEVTPQGAGAADGGSTT